jgi:MraZ protein
MLIGEFESKLTDKNRIALPKKFREEIGDTFIITQGYEGSVILVDESRLLALTQEIRDGSFVNDAIRDTTRFLIGSAHEAKLDKQGRFVLPQSLRSFSEIESDVIFLGLMRWVEIWSKDVWLQRKTLISNEAAKIASRLPGAA